MSYYYKKEYFTTIFKTPLTEVLINSSNFSRAEMYLLLYICSVVDRSNLVVIDNLYQSLTDVKYKRTYISRGLNELKKKNFIVVKEDKYFRKCIYLNRRFATRIYLNVYINSLDNPYLIFNDSKDSNKNTPPKRYNQLGDNIQLSQRPLREFLEANELTRNQLVLIYYVLCQVDSNFIKFPQRKIQQLMCRNTYQVAIKELMAMEFVLKNTKSFQLNPMYMTKSKSESS